MKMRNLLAMLLAVVLCVSCLPMVSMANGLQETNGQAAENLLAAEGAYWIFSNNKTADAEGNPTLSWNYATFIGKKVGDQKITLTFNANMVKDGAWMGIQFRGELNPEEAKTATTAEYFASNNDALALVIKSKGTQISINGGNGEGSPTRLSDNADVNLADGNDHVIELITARLESGKVGITVNVDGETKLTYEAAEKYDRAGYVTVGASSGDDVLTVKSLAVEGLSVSDYQVNQAISDEENLMLTNREYWGSFVYSDGSVAWTDAGMTLSHGTATFLGTKAGSQKITVTAKTPLTSNGFIIQFRGNMDAAMSATANSYATKADSGNISLGFRVRNNNTGVSLNESYSTGGAGMTNTGTVSTEQTNALSSGNAYYTVDIITTDINETTTNVKIYVDGIKVIDKDRTGILSDGYVSFACEGTDTVEITGLSIAGVDADPYAQNMLNTGESFWVYANEMPRQEDGSLLLNNNFATFVGSKVQSQMITVEFIASVSNWIAIQFRGDITPELASDSEEAAYYSISNDALALVIKNGGNQISINAGNGAGSPTRLSDNADVTLGDGNKHTIQILATDRDDGKVDITVYVDGSKKLTYTAAEKYAKAGYVAFGNQGANDSFSVTRFSIDGLKASDYPMDEPEESDKDLNLLGAEQGYWKIAADSDEDGFQEDGSMELSNAFATFIGQKAGAQTITVKFSASLKDWAAIQFRGDVTAEQAEDSNDAAYYSLSNQALALVIKNGGNQISINTGNGAGAPTRLSDNVDVTLGDGQEHTLQIVTEDREDGKVNIEIFVDGVSVLVYVAAEAYADAGYVTIAAQGVSDLFKVTYFGVEDVKTSELSLGAVDSWGLILGDNIGVKFDMSLNEFIAQSDTSKIRVFVGDELTEMDIPAPVNGKYVFCVNVAAAQMTETIKLQVADGNLRGPEYEYTVRAYADYILDDKNGYSETVKTLVREMLNYGGAAQTYFDYKTKAMANDGVEVTPAQIPAEIEAVKVSGQVNGIRYYGSSVLFDTKIVVRYYFDVSGAADTYSFTMDGQTFEAVEKNGLWYVDVPGVNPQELEDINKLTVSDGLDSLTVEYSPMHYIVRMYYGNGSDALKSLLQALYGYHLAANIYVEQLAPQTLDVSAYSSGDWEEPVALTDPID